jgi:Leucine-rich repeat (LRR) protein
MKTLSLSLFILLSPFIPVFAQDINDIAGKMNFPGNLPTPRFAISFPDSVKGISIVYEDLESITAQKLEKLKEIELVELRFSNQFELDKEVELLQHFPAMKYLVLGDWKYGSKTTTAEIKLPEILASFKKIIALKFSGEWKIDYLKEQNIIGALPNLQYLFFQDFQQPIPDLSNELGQLKGISLQNSKIVSFPEWITGLSRLESISLAMANFSPKGLNHLNYVDVLTKLQKLPLISSLYLSYLYDKKGDFDKLKFENLTKIELHSVDFKTNQSLLTFLANQHKLQSIRITSSSPQTLDANFSNLKQLTNLTIIGLRDSLTIGFNLKDLTKLKSLTLSNVKLLLNESAFPANLVNLDLSETNIAVLPKGISKAYKLETLRIAYDSIMILPDNISDLKRLKHLDVSNNLLKKLPEHIGNLRKLQTLNVSSNPIVEFPKNIGRLKHLTNLETQHGNLTELPASLGRLGRLEVIDVSDNFIKQIPESIVDLGRLKTLNLSNNQLMMLPDLLGEMSALEHLDASFNNISRIPVSIRKLQTIKTIDFSFNDLDSFPDQISNLRSLQELYLNTGKVHEIIDYNNERAIYRKDDPKPTKRLTVNRIKNFPEDLRNWTSLSKLDLRNNNEINSEQLYKGLFTIPSKGYSVDLENCGISYFPKEGWERFFGKSLNLRDNQIKEISGNIGKAPYLSQINLNGNRLKMSPNDLNQYAGNPYEKALWFVDLGFITDKDLPRTDSMVFALVDKSNNHYYRKEYKQAVELANIALTINDSLAMSRIFLTNMGEANYEVGKYRTAINYLSNAINRDTAGSVRIMNLVIPDFEFRAKSYLKIGDTLSAIRDYETLAEKFSDSWGDVGLLYTAIRKPKPASIAFQKGIKKYETQIAYLKEARQSPEMYQLSLLELLIISEDFNRAIKYATELEREFKLIQHIALLRHLKASAEIGNNSFNMKSKSELLRFLKVNKEFISGWSYDLFFKWLSVAKISEEKVRLVRDITEDLKP